MRSCGHCRLEAPSGVVTVVRLWLPGESPRTLRARRVCSEEFGCQLLNRAVLGIPYAWHALLPFLDGIFENTGSRPFDLQPHSTQSKSFFLTSWIQGARRVLDPAHWFPGPVRVLRGLSHLLVLSATSRFY